MEHTIKQEKINTPCSTNDNEGFEMRLETEFEPS